MEESNNDKKTILVAVDESEESMYALSWCLHNLLPQNKKSNLVLLYVKPPPPVYSSLDATGKCKPPFFTAILLLLACFVLAHLFFSSWRMEILDPLVFLFLSFFFFLFFLLGGGGWWC